MQKFFSLFSFFTVLFCLFLTSCGGNDQEDIKHLALHFPREFYYVEIPSGGHTVWLDITGNGDYKTESENSELITSNVITRKNDNTDGILAITSTENATIGAETVVNIIDNKTHNGMSVRVKIVPDYLILEFNQSPYTAMYAFLIRNSQEAYFFKTYAEVLSGTPYYKGTYSYNEEMDKNYFFFDFPSDLDGLNLSADVKRHQFKILDPTNEVKEFLHQYFIGNNTTRSQIDIYPNSANKEFTPIVFEEDGRQFNGSISLNVLLPYHLFD